METPSPPKRKQFRRSVTLRTSTYERIKAYCESHDYSMSSVVEHVIALAIEAKDRLVGKAP